VRVDASGNVGIGTSSPSDTIGYGRALDIQSNSGAAIYLRDSDAPTTQYSFIAYDGNDNGLKIQNQNSSGFVRFSTAGTERARITSNGLFRNHSSEGVFRVNTSQGAGTTYELFWGGFGGSSTTAEGTNSIKIYTNGNIQNTNNSYGSLSDAKLKENVTDATPKLDKLNQVRVVNYNLKGESGHETHKQIGVIAQELEQIFPGMVEESPDRDAEGNDLGTVTKSVKYSVFVPMLIKAIQEQQALIASQSEIISAQQTALTALTARVEAQEVRLTSLEGAQA
jgi:hypothetical protein